MILSGKAGPRGEYQRIEIRVFPSADGGQTYPVELQVPDWRSFAPGSLRLATARLAELAADPRAYGQALGEQLFADTALGPAIRETLAAIQARQSSLRFRLRIDPPELQTLVWERVFAPIDGSWLPLAAMAETPFSRHVLVQSWERPVPATERPLRLLAVIASPGSLETFGLDPISAEERQALHKLLDALPGVAVTYLESGTPAPPTVNRLRAALADSYHIVHFLCHGATTDHGTALYLEDEAGAVDLVRSERLLEAFHLVKTPPLLCFLAACESAARSQHSAALPLGPALVERSGVVAVIAMGDKVGLSTARLFTSQFYTRLLHHGLIDLATNEARAQVQDQWDWGVPMLLCRLHDSQLVDFPAGRPIAEVAAVATTMERALKLARTDAHGQQLVSDLERLLSAFEGSFRTLVRFGSEFRAVSDDPKLFVEQFKRFYLSFKQYYDQETFSDEQALLREMMRLRADLLPSLQPLLDPTVFQQLDAELDQMAVNRAGLIKGFGAYLEPMNTAVDGIKQLVDRGEIAAAIAEKQAFETQISPGLRRSRELLTEISEAIGRVQAA